VASDAAIYLRAAHDQRSLERARSEQARMRAEQQLQRVKDAADRIKRMTELYRERLDGRRGQ
jgi:hypothetical protein